jgi:hypothetical protein
LDASSFSGSKYPERQLTKAGNHTKSGMCKSETYVLDASFNPEEFVEDIKKAKAAVGEASHEDGEWSEWKGYPLGPTCCPRWIAKSG